MAFDSASSDASGRFNTFHETLNSTANDGTFVIWLYAFLSVIIISICGLVPIICMPRLQRSKHQNDLLQFLIGLAIGTLTADALLHLLPISSQKQAHKLMPSYHRLNSSSIPHSSTTSLLHNNHDTNDPDHDHEHSSSSPGLIPLEAKNHQPGTDLHDSLNDLDNHATNNHKDHFGHSHSHNDEGFWFGFMALIGIIGFLLLERIMLLLTDVCTHQEHSSLPCRNHSNNNSKSKPKHQNPSSITTVVDGELTVAQVHNDPHQVQQEQDQLQQHLSSSPKTESVSLPLTDPHLHHHQNHHQHQHHHLTNKTKSFMFMIITGDGLHNFFDGIAIGVSYGSNLAVGISTSIAILCHELPHEIGDFAVLIKSGMSIKRAVLYNTLSSILCLLGATTGVFIGKIDVGWVSALIAGMFLYISLVDMVPQLDCYPMRPPLIRAKKLVIQFMGIVSGVMIMSLIAIYESRLHSLITTTYNHNH